MLIFGDRHLHSILLSTRPSTTEGTPVAAVSSGRRSSTISSAALPRSRSGADSSSAGSSTNTSRLGRSPGQRLWPNSGTPQAVWLVNREPLGQAYNPPLATGRGDVGHHAGNTARPRVVAGELLGVGQRGPGGAAGSASSTRGSRSGRCRPTPLVKVEPDRGGGARRPRRSPSCSGTPSAGAARCRLANVPRVPDVWPWTAGRAGLSVSSGGQAAPAGPPGRRP
jgi:hypothetical protein